MRKTPGILFLLVFCFFIHAGLAAESEDPAFEPLFNGVNLVGWTVAAGHAKDWSVENGEMVVLRRSEGAARELRTARKYRDFELHLEFTVSEDGNSGVFFRMEDDDIGLEIQLLDDYAPRHEDLRDWQYTGALYGLAGPTRQVSKPAGEWQTMAIRLQEQNFEVTLNGVAIVEANLDELADREDAAKYREFLLREKGNIGLQNYGSETRFRNLRIREL